MLDEKILRKKIMAALEPKRQALRPQAKDPALDLHTMTEEYVTYGHRLEPYISDTARLTYETLQAGKTVVFEGAQGTLLDIDHGTYPFVTSSNPVAGAACIGTGVGPTEIDEVWGVAKAYATRVGEGPFPTELSDDTGRHMLERGHEYGTTTGRARRCGWLDLVALRYAKRINGLTSLVITKLDVLAGIDPIRVCTSYRHSEGASFDEFPYHQSILHNSEAVYEEFPGFADEIGDCRTPADLPAPALDYLNFISKSVGIPIRLVGVGPGREQAVRMGETVTASAGKRVAHAG
jgi:adenylosuccinate synthase